MAKSAKRAKANSRTQTRTKAKGRGAAKAASKAKAAPKAKPASKAKAPAQAKPAAKLAAKSKPAPKASKPTRASKPAPAAKSPAKAGRPPARASAQKVAAQAKSGTRVVEWASFFTPLDDRVLVIREGAAERTSGGLFIPDTAADRPNRGVVVAVGRGHLDDKGRLRPLDVKVNDRVIYGQYAGAEVKMQDVEAVVLREKDLLGVLK